MATLDLVELLGDSLLSNEGSGGFKRTPSADLRGKVVGVYFSAHWCPPCRQFTPLLRDTYNKLRAAGKQFEVVFVSSDRSREQFEDYFASMPWLAVPFEDSAARARLARHFSVMGIPALIILGPAGEGQAGERVLTHHGRAAVMRDPGGAEFPWEGARQGMLEGLLQSPVLLLLLLLAAWKFSQWALGALRG